MNYKDFICHCLGIYDGEWLDNIQLAFECKGLQTANEMDALIERLGKSRYLGTAIASALYREVAQRAEEMYGVDFDDFDWVCDGPLGSHLYYRNTEVKSWSELKSLLDNENKCNQQK